MTFSVALRRKRTGAIGVAVASSSPAVASRCLHIRPRVGAVLSQNLTDPRLGPRGLDLMAQGETAATAMDRLVAETPEIDFRQLVMMDAEGETAVWSGARALGVSGAIARRGAAVAGNLLARASVLERMIEASAVAEGTLGDQLLRVMQAAIAEGGEAGPVHSAGMAIVADLAWPVTDLRVDWHESDPIGELGRLWAIWKPQAGAYVQRALAPELSPSFGVRGDP